MLSKQQVEHIAKLARITLTEEETAKFQRELSHVLEYFSMLDKVDVSEIQLPLASVHTVRTEREDTVRAIDEDTRKKLIEAILESQDGFIKVRGVFNQKTDNS